MVNASDSEDKDELIMECMGAFADSMLSIGTIAEAVGANIPEKPELGQNIKTTQHGRCKTKHCCRNIIS